MDALGYTANIVPKRFPMLLHIPHVGSLEHRHYITDVFAEDLRQAQRFCSQIILLYTVRRPTKVRNRRSLITAIGCSRSSSALTSSSFWPFVSALKTG